MAEFLSPVYRRDDMFFRRLNRKFLRLEFLASHVRRRKINAIPIFWAEMWELLPIFEKDKSRHKLGRWCMKKLIHLRRCIDTRNRKIMFVDTLIREMNNVYMNMRISLFPLELKQEEEEMSVRDLLMERAM